MKRLFFLIIFAILFLFQSNGDVSAAWCSNYDATSSWTCNGGYSGGCNCTTGKLQWCCTSASRTVCTWDGCESYAYNMYTCYVQTTGGYCYDLSTSCSCCTDCTPTCPAGSATSPVTAYPVTASCSRGSGCGTNTITCYYQRQNLCSSTSTSRLWLKPGESTTITSTANTNVNDFIYIFYNRENLDASGIPRPICLSAPLSGWATTQGSCPSGTYQLIRTNIYATARTSESTVIPANNIFRADANWGGRTVKYAQVNGYYRINGRPISLPNANCVENMNSCAPLCVPRQCEAPAFTTTATTYGSVVYTCANTPSECGSQSRTCYCTGNCTNTCPFPLSNTPVVASPNLSLANFVSCSNECGVYRVSDCHERPSRQPTATIDIVKYDPNTYGFSSTTHAGRMFNNPTSMVARYTDLDVNGASQIEAIFVWFREDSLSGTIDTPLRISTTASPNGWAENNWGFMMRKEDTGGWFPYVYSDAEATTTWTKALYNVTNREFYIPSSTGTNMVRVVLDGDITAIDLNTVEMKFSMYFLENPATAKETKYKIYLLGLDNFSFTPNDNYLFSVDLYWAPNQLRYRTLPAVSQIYAKDWKDSGKTLALDFQLPEVYSLDVTTVTSGNSLILTWSVRDVINTYSNLYTVVGNIYSTSPADARNLTITGSSGVVVTSPYMPTGFTTPGVITDDAAFRVPLNMTVNNSSGSITIDIGENRVGSLLFYVTVFDDAGNMATDSKTYNLNDWLTTDGGLVYSASGTSYSTRSFPEGTTWLGVLPPWYKKLTDAFWSESLIPSKADLSSEMFAESESPLGKSSDTLHSYTIQGHGGSLITSYYSNFRDAYLEKRDTIVGLTEIPLEVSNTILQANLTVTCKNGPPYCVLIKSEGTLTINPGFTCDQNGLIFVNGDIIINSNILNANKEENRQGCIFVASGDVIINEGTNASTSSFGYDMINAYIIADGKILVNKETATKTYYDGLYINGGLIGGNGIEVERYLKLTDRLKYPVIAIDYHPKYGVLGGVFFGSNFNMQKLEVGFKPF